MIFIFLIFPFAGMRIFLMKFTIKRYFYVESEYNNFFEKSIVQKLFNIKIIIPISNTEESQILIFPIFSILTYKIQRYIIFNLLCLTEFT